MVRRLVIVALFMLSLSPLWAQTDSVAIVDDEPINFRYTPIDQTSVGRSADGGSGRSFLDYLTGEPVEVGRDAALSTFVGLGYSSATSLRLGLLGQLSYRPAGVDRGVSASTLSLSGAVSISGYYRIALLGNNYFGRGNHRLSYSADVCSQPSDLWGFNYDESLYGSAGRYTSKRYVAWARYSYAVLRDFYVGLYADYRYLSAVRTDARADALLGDRLRSTSAAGVGVNVALDTRDVATNASKGVYAAVEFIVRPSFVSSLDYDTWQLTAVVDYYQSLWRGAILAFDLYGEVHSAATPWLLRAQLGGDERMRGYYPGRFNGDNLFAAQVELRQHIWHRLGCVVWGGGGVAFSADDRFAWRKVLPTYGLGLRWALHERSNLRIDAGFGRKSYALILGIDESF